MNQYIQIIGVITIFILMSCSLVMILAIPSKQQLEMMLILWMMVVSVITALIVF